MKTPYKIALMVSALTAGFLISCTKPSDNQNSPTNQDQINDNQTDQNQATTQIQNSNAYLSHVAKGIILPNYQNSLTKAQDFTQKVQTACQKPTVDDAALQDLRQAWLALAQAWAMAEVVNFGTVTDNMQHLYINFFPDERGLVAKDLNALLTTKETITPALLEQESAIIQGIPALEYVLFNHQSLDKRQCEYLLSATHLLTERLALIVNDWQQNSDDLLAIYEPPSDIGLNQWFNAILALLEVSKSNALDKPLAITGNKKGHLPAPVAKQSKQIFVAKLAILAQIVGDPQLATLLLVDDPAMINNGQHQLKSIQDLLATLPDDLAAANPDEQKQLYVQLSELTKWLKNELMPTVGVPVGFNGTDGD